MSSMADRQRNQADLSRAARCHSNALSVLDNRLFMRMSYTMRVADVRTQPARRPRIRPRIIGKVAAEQTTHHRVGPTFGVGQPRQLLAVLTDGISCLMMPNVKMPLSALVSDGAVYHGTEEVGSVTPEADLAEPVVTLSERLTWDQPFGNGQRRSVGDLHLRAAARRIHPVSAE